jgi:methylthioribose-1-phosphate isomerase
LTVGEQSVDETRESLIEHAEALKTARPTAVNLATCCDLVIERLRELRERGDALNERARETVVRVAHDVLKREVNMNENMSRHGASLINDGDNVMTHCNTGSLATPGFGTALGAIKYAHQVEHKRVHVWVDETRPLLQGARLTAYELQRANIPYTLICDNMAASVMRDGRVQRVMVGADRIALNGDFANKIGTYPLAICAQHHRLPFHVVAPVSTVDFRCQSGADIPIEQRSPAEVLGVGGQFAGMSGGAGYVRWAPEHSQVFNPAFDVTPGSLVTSIVLDTGVHSREDIAERNSLKSLKPMTV